MPLNKNNQKPIYEINKYFWNEMIDKRIYFGLYYQGKGIEGKKKNGKMKPILVKILNVQIKYFNKTLKEIIKKIIKFHYHFTFIQ